MALPNVQQTVSTAKEVWPVVVLIATSIGALVAFLLHMVTARKFKLEIKKLHYEIERLERERKSQESLVKIATDADVEKYILRDLTRAASAPAPAPRHHYAAKLRAGFFARLLPWLVAAVILLVLYRYFFK
jgi:hypothetical protein